METSGGEIILYDLLAWAPHLTLASPREPGATFPDPLAREIVWVVTVRATPPMLPFLSGGELVILPHKIIRETGIPFTQLFNELSLQPIAGILTDEPISEMPEGPLAILNMPRFEPDTESEINRLLASRRRELLRRTAETDRLLREAQANLDRPGEIVNSLSRLLDIPVSVLTNDGTVLLAIDSDHTPVEQRRAPDWLPVPLHSDQTLWLGPILPEKRAQARMTIGRIGSGLQRTLNREASTVPRGNARASSLHALLLPESTMSNDMLVDQAFRASIPPGRSLHVALAAAELGSHHTRQALAPLGEIHGAGTIDGLPASVVVSTPSSPHDLVPVMGGINGWIAISSAINSARSLPVATRQARYLAGLLTSKALPGPVVRFDDDASLGVYRVLYPLWGTPELARYRSAVLKDVYREDRHGILLETLRIFLEEGGALRPTAERLNIHRNTLAYRLRRIRDVIDTDFDAPHVRLALQIALTADTLPDAPE